MSTAPPTPPTPGTPKPAQATSVPNRPPELPSSIRIVSHCTLFYWWPVWAVGFLMALITFFDPQRAVMVPADADPVLMQAINADGKVDFPSQVVWASKKHPVVNLKAPQEEKEIRLSQNRSLGVVYAIILLLVIAITNVPLRGLWSVIVMVVIVALSIIFALLKWWDPILHAISILDIRINFEGYLLVSTVLFILWCVVFFFFDDQIYMVFTPGQLRVRQAIGDAETAYDTTGMTIQKQRSDLFRHWILGIGSGDLIVNTTGAQSHHFEMPNVLFLGSKVNQIEMMLSSKQVVATQER